MRFMMIAIPTGYDPAASDWCGDAEGAAKMMEYNQSLQKAGVLLAINGLCPPSAAARVSFANGKTTVSDGPFAEAKEVFGGYWLIQARSREEAIEWAKRAPCSSDVVIEVRQVLEAGDFPEDVQKEFAGYENLPS